MENSAVYDPRRSATPEQLREAAAQAARRQRFSAAARAERPAARPVLVESLTSSIGQLKPARESDYGCMWFYDLIFGTARIAPFILAAPTLYQHPPVERIQQVVANFYGVTRADMISARRTAAIVHPRQVAYWLSKTLTPKSYPEIGRRFGNRDHTSILFGFRKIELLRSTNAQLRADIEYLIDKIGFREKP